MWETRDGSRVKLWRVILLRLSLAIPCHDPALAKPGRGAQIQGGYPPADD